MLTDYPNLIGFDQRLAAILHLLMTLLSLPQICSIVMPS